MSNRPLEAFFPTGHAGQTLALMICTDWIWAGLYDGKVTPSLDGCAVAPRLRARTTARHLCIGRDTFALHRAYCCVPRAGCGNTACTYRSHAHEPHLSAQPCSWLDSGGDHRGHLRAAAPGRTPRGTSQRRRNAGSGQRAMARPPHVRLAQAED